MNKVTLRAILAAGTAVLALSATPASATNGYFAAGYSTQSKGMAGAGLTTAEGAMGLAQNPALGVAIGNSAEADITIFMPFRSATFDNAFVAKSGTYESDQNVFPMMSLGANYLLGENTSVGVVMYGNGGMNTNYQTLSLMGGTTPVGVDLAQAFMALNLAHRFQAANLTVGVAPVLAMQYFEAYGLTSFAAMSSSPSNVSDYGYDVSFGGGVRAGVVWDALPWLSVGATYQSKMWMSKFDDYKGLFADGGSFDIPASAQAGITFKPMRGLDVMLEWQRIFYGDVSSIANTGTFSDYSQLLGLQNGLGFGWKDMDVFRLGVQWQATAELTVRGGYSHATDFTDSSQVLFNTIAPATITDHISVGLTYNFTPNWLVTAAYTYAFENSLSGSIATSFGGGTETIRMDQHELSVGMTYKF
jgi:long-chain fatty acid transport protein